MHIHQNGSDSAVQAVPKVTGSMGTLSGQRIQLDNDEHSMLRLDDLIIGMARQPRFCGQTTRPVSVLAHSIEVARSCAHHSGAASLEEISTTPGAVQWTAAQHHVTLQGLLHDTSEGLICDIPSPLKTMQDMGGYRRVERQMLYKIGEALACDLLNMDPLVKEADQEVLRREARAYCPKNDWAGREAMRPGAAYSNLKDEVDAFCALMRALLASVHSQTTPESRATLEAQMSELQASIASGEIQ